MDAVRISNLVKKYGTVVAVDDEYDRARGAGLPIVPAAEATSTPTGSQAASTPATGIPATGIPAAGVRA